MAASGITATRRVTKREKKGGCVQTHGGEGGAALLAEVMAASEPRELGAGLVVVAHLARVGVLLECELALGLVVAEELS